MTAVSDGQQAIDRIVSDRPDIVLADVGMPKHDGYEVAAFIKADPALKHIPVLLLTGAFEPVDEDRARAVSCDGVLAKPFEPQLLIGRVKELLKAVTPSAPVGPAAEAEDGDAAVPGFPGRRLDRRSGRVRRSTSTTTRPSSWSGRRSCRPTATRRSKSSRSTCGPNPRLRGTAARSTTTSIGSTRPSRTSPAGSPAETAGRPVLEPTRGPRPCGRHRPGRRPPPSLTRPPWTNSTRTAARRWSSAPARTSGRRRRRPTTWKPWRPGAPPVPSASGPAVAAVPVADAFAALLDAEREHGVDAVHPEAPDAAAMVLLPGTCVTAAFVDDVARRVIERLGEPAFREVVRDVVPPVAERLIREEIERIKASV